jgi:hypothetical protein
MGKEVKMLKNHAHFRPDFFNVFDIIRQLNAIHNDFSALVFFQTVYATDQGRFAGAGRSANNNTFLFLDSQIYALQDMKFTEPFMHLLDCDHDFILGRLGFVDLGLGLIHNKILFFIKF